MGQQAEEVVVSGSEVQIETQSTQMGECSFGHLKDKHPYPRLSIQDIMLNDGKVYRVSGVGGIGGIAGGGA